MNRILYSVTVLVVSLTLTACLGRQTKKATEQQESASTAAAPVNETPPEREMVYFKGGTFTMGSNTGPANERPAHKVTVKPFGMDKSPVTVGDFRRFIKATGYITQAAAFGDSGVFNLEQSRWVLVPGANWEYPFGPNGPKADDNMPVTHVSWNDAVAYAKWEGKRLPTEAEWEYAATCSGTSKTKYSWGNDLIMGGKYMANVWQGDGIMDKQGADGFLYTSPVGFYGETPCGLTDMGGNVWNWCSDIFLPYPGNTDFEYEVMNSGKAIRGGSFFFDPAGDRSYTVTFRAMNTQETSLFNTGFRCAADM